MRNNEPVTVAQLAEFDEVIDVRSEAEFAEDHIPGATNCPVLDNKERIRVGTLYKQISPFDAKKVGAALVSRNIARHIEENLAQRPRHWKPLIYCWRGGTRSGALTSVLQQIGWRANRLEGGYKTYRRAVIDELANVIDETPDVVKSRLRELVAEYGSHATEGPDTAPIRKAHAK